MIPRFSVYLFDVDGTLLDSVADISASIREALTGHCVGELSEAYLRGTVGHHLLDTFQELLPQYSDDQHWEIIREYRRIYPARGHRLTKVYPGVVEMLGALGGRKSTATTKSSETTRAILGQFGLARYFDHVQGTDGFPAKPEPDVVLRSLEALGACPEECLLVGDAAPDMIAGRRAGVQTCAVTYGYGDPEAMRQAQPDYWIDSPTQLLP